MRRPSPIKSTRRAVLAGAGAGALTAAAVPLSRWVSAQTDSVHNVWVNVLCPHPPDPSPPGVAPYGVDLFNAWQWRETIWVAYEPVAWSLLDMRIEAALRAPTHVYDLIAMTGWAARYRAGLEPLTDMLPSMLLDDLAPDALRAFTWEDQVYGLPSTLSLLTLFVNAAHLGRAGIGAPPASWDELRHAAAELTRDGRYGWVTCYGTPGGIGGVASQWMAYLQQAGGAMYDTHGLPAFDNEAGVAALQIMIDLLPFTHPSALTNVGIDDATIVFQRGEASMMPSWPGMWHAVQDPAQSAVAGLVSAAVLPAGPAGTASIDGADGWTIAKRSKDIPEVFQLILFYLNRRVQEAMVREMGWLPARLSMLADPEVQQVAPHAATVLEQAKHPFNSFITPDYAEVTDALGTELLRGLRGEAATADAIRAGAEAVASVVRARPK